MPSRTANQLPSDLVEESPNTENERLRRRVALLESVIDGLSFGIAFCDEQGATELNAAAREAVGDPTSENRLFASDGETELSWCDLPLDAALHEMAAGAIEFFSHNELLDSRQQMHCSAWPLVNEDDESAGAVAVIEDVTLREETLSQLAESEFALGLAVDQALLASRAKGDFLATMSHEIRTPMNGIMGMAEMLTCTTLDAQQREYVDLVLKSADSLMELINQILDFSKLESGEMTTKATDFSLLALVSDTCKLLSPAASNKGLQMGYSYHMQLPGRVCADDTKIRQMLVNLIGNAIKFTHEGSVRVEVGLVPEVAERRLRIDVIDTGIGIPEAVREKIFDAFQQADSSTTRKYGGTGLGLAICRRYAQLLGGDITIMSVDGEGSTFRLDLPFGPARAHRVEPSVQRTQHDFTATSSLKVLVVEDNPVNQKLVELQLRNLGHKPELAEDGPTALNLFTNHQYDVILMDWSLPKMTGPEVTARIRAIELVDGRRRVHIIGFTANVMQEHREACLAAGMDEFLAKPCSIIELGSALDRADPNNDAKAEAMSESILHMAAIDELRSLSDDKDFLREIIEVFIADASLTVSELRAAARNNDQLSAEKLSHRLKSACGALGALKLAGSCSDMESRCHDAKELNDDEWMDLLRNIDQQLSRAVGALQTEIAGPTRAV